MKRHLLALGAMVALAPVADAAERWRVQFFHDEFDSALTINDLKFLSPLRGVAAGYLTEGNRIRPVALVTSDGGETWSFVKIKGAGFSLFFLNESVGWMVTEKGLWKTEESGRSWRKVKAPKGVRRVYFLDENRGWAVGLEKGFYETSDGGRRWRRVPAVDEVNSRPETTLFTSIAFADRRRGLIAGASLPPRPRPSRLPDWIDPEQAERRRQWPTLTVLLESRDGGKTWTPSTSSMFGQITRVCLAPDGRGLGLVEFREEFPWPSEVMGIDWTTGKNTRVFRRKDRAVTDIALLPKGPAYLAAIEPAGTLQRSPVPGRLRLLTSDDLVDWREMEVDYRAVARRATLAVFDENHAWVATDTGMILKLVREPR